MEFFLLKKFDGVFNFTGIVSTFPVTVISLITHINQWYLYGSTSINTIITLGLNSKRITLGQDCKYGGGYGLNIYYGGTNHFDTNSYPNFKGINDWNMINWRLQFI